MPYSEEGTEKRDLGLIQTGEGTGNLDAIPVGTLTDILVTPMVTLGLTFLTYQHRYSRVLILSTVTCCFFIFFPFFSFFPLQTRAEPYPFSQRLCFTGARVENV